MTISQTPISVSERRLAIARRLYGALVAQQPDRVFTLSDGQGRVRASSAKTPGQDAEDNLNADVASHCSLSFVEPGGRP
jgi:hypothetical protein